LPGAFLKNSTPLKPRRRSEEDETEYLDRLGRRLRQARAKRGMTRKILAADSGVSERFLAQLEAGKGNPSLLVMRQIARAMNFPVDELIMDAPLRPVDQALIIHLLNRLSPDELAAARKLLTSQFSTLSGALRPIALIGLRGAGKSTLGRLLAEHMKVKFVELNRVIEEDFGAPVAEILALYGQTAYRRTELRCLERIVTAQEPVVIATGGGMASDPEALQYLLENCRSVWVRARPEEHMQRVIAQGDMRPMAQNREAMADLKQILEAREPYYSQAEYELDTSGQTLQQSLRDLISLLF
jgi:XRE family aerobic/anaerobic benzoate catabolism transcriptional regulator